MKKKILWLEPAFNILHGARSEDNDNIKVIWLAKKEEGPRHFHSPSQESNIPPKTKYKFRRFCCSPMLTQLMTHYSFFKCNT